MSALMIVLVVIAERHALHMWYGRDIILPYLFLCHSIVC